MGISTQLERVSYGGPAGSIHAGQHRQVISEAVATRQLLAKESGALCVFDVAAGTVYTLPTPVEGMYFDFTVKVSVTSNAHKVITKTVASEFIVGAVVMMTIATATGAGFSANGTNIVAISAAGTTTGGLIGESYRLVALSATLWSIAGVSIGSGTIATPFATS